MLNSLFSFGQLNLDLRTLHTPCNYKCHWQIDPFCLNLFNQTLNGHPKYNKRVQLNFDLLGLLIFALNELHEDCFLEHFERYVHGK
jgi:hypothetical protein